jgi:hypothetical protein
MLFANKPKINQNPDAYIGDSNVGLNKLIKVNEKKL